MTRVIALSGLGSTPAIEIVRMAIVCGCALALIAAKAAFPL